MLNKQAQNGPTKFVVCIFGNQSRLPPPLYFLNGDIVYCKKINNINFSVKIVWDSAKDNFANNLDVDFWTINNRKTYCQNKPPSQMRLN